MATPDAQDLQKLLEEIAANPKGEALARRVHALALSALDERRTELEQGIADAAERLGVDETTSDTSYGNVLRALKKGASATGPEKALLGVLLVRGVALLPPEDEKGGERALLGLAWVAANTPADGLAVLDAVLGEKGAGVAGSIWTAA